MTTSTINSRSGPRHAVARTRMDSPASPSARAGERSWPARLVLGRRTDPAWARPSLWALLVATAVLYLYKLTESGYANEFYAASVKSATQSWRAWLWGSLDSQLSITVDKPPAAIWVMGLSARIFGFSSFSLLLPEALMGVATVALTHGAVRRLSGHGAGLVAGAAVMVTPVAALMFRFDNPDALLVLCVTAAAYMVVRALQSERRALWWMVGAGWLIGLAFLTKMLQGLLVLPALALAYLLFARAGWGRRFVHLLAAAASLVVSAGWLIALCAIWPASARPYIGGSTNNSLWELALGYNGLGRVLGGQGNGGGGGGFGGTAGLLRLVNSQFVGEISWLLPAALILLVAGLIGCGRRSLTDGNRAGLVLWGGSLLTTAAVFSYMQGTIHSYYAVALAPLIAGTLATGAAEVWSHSRGEGRTAVVWRAILAGTVIVTGWWGFHVMATYAPSWHSWIRWVALVGSVVGALGYLIVASLARGGMTGLRKAAVVLLAVGSLAAVTPSASWTAATVATAHSGSTPTSGPAVAGTGRMGGMGGAPSSGAPSGNGGPGSSSGTSSNQNGAPSGTPPSGTKPSGTAPSGSTSSTSGSTSTSTDGQAGGMGGGMGGASTSAALVKLLNNAGTKWSAAVVGDQSAAGLILNTDTAIYSIGGWSGSDNNITLAQFKQLVANGSIHYFIASGQGGGGMGGGANSSASQITSWVTSTFSSTTVGGTTVYDLTKTN
ncbi:ArnT family glycosyltransferase [Acidipropionibacterium timonense]|uniref:ArnT family glycosyltransferase n=1 Tax=Acidipropionibacterium timonense TaxID=2161818 RepID=UPI001031DC53|nr:glycosyltransferase family 39 protein [Acidipropionibacterium timonense]